MLRPRFGNVADEALEARPGVGVKLDFLVARFCHAVLK